MELFRDFLVGSGIACWLIMLFLLACRFWARWTHP